MRRFSFYLFEDFDPDREAGNSLNPRRVLTEALNGALDAVAAGCSWEALCGRWGEEAVERAVACGVLRKEGRAARFDAPVFLEEDAARLTAVCQREAEELTNRLSVGWKALVRLADSLENGFDASVNLYHLVCGVVLDGALFDALCEAGVVATSRPHPSGLSYIAVAYERCEALDGLSRRLLCSWNRAIGETCVLQSFGDADGDRFDPYRWYRMKESGRIDGDMPEKEKLTREARRLIETGSCAEDCLRALTVFGYAKDGRMAVPVYGPGDAAVMDEVARIVREVILEEVAALLRQGVREITPERHGVNRAETANELYHLLFGHINEALVRRGMVATPQKRPGEGRYLQSVQLI